MRSKHLISAAAIAASFVLSACQSAAQGPTAAPGPALRINVDADRHAINRDIYGMNFPDSGLAMELHLPVARNGGDATTRYNWQMDSTNSGGDWYFMAGNGQDHPTPSASMDKFVAANNASQTKSILTIPVIDYIDRESQTDCSFPVSLFGPQKSVNPYVHPTIGGKQTDAGNGVRPDGSNITLTTEEKLRINILNSPEFQEGWVKHLVSKFGDATHGGVAIYQLDNEPSGWNNTHRDVHPDNTGYDELISRSLKYAAAVKSVDPTASVLGPSDFGIAVWDAGGKPGDDAKAHGGEGFAEYYLQQFHAYEQRHGKRILDYFDEHYYPISNDGIGGIGLSPTGDGATQALRLESTRSLWDPTYVESNWIGKYKGAIDAIPTFHKWVDANYPGTKIAITEYNWGALDSMNGALAEADLLGIFGRERLDLATLWGAPKSTAPGAYAFRIYLDYDGAGAHYGQTWVRSVSDDQGRLAVYGAERTDDGALTIVVINKSGDDLASPLSVFGFKAAGTVSVYRYSAADLTRIVKQPDASVNSGTVAMTYPANSITLLVMHGSRTTQ